MEGNTINRSKTFETEMMDTGRIKNLACGSVFFIYALYSSGIIRLMSVKELIVFSATVVIIALIAQFLVAPVTNRMLTRDISDRIGRNKQNLLSTDERTVLLKDVLSLPLSISMEVLAVIFFASVITVSILLIKYRISSSLLIHVVFSCCFGLYISAIAAFCYAETLCCKVATKLIEKGINKATIHKDRFYGASTKKRVFYFAILPVILSAILQTTMVNLTLSNQWNESYSMAHIAFVVLCNAIMTVSVAWYLNKNLTVNTKNIRSILEKLTDRKKDLFLPTDLSHELSYSIFLIDELINYLKDLSHEAATTGEEIFASSGSLSKDANLTAETSISEAAAIRECLATMENAKNQHKRISSYIDSIQKSASTTKISADKSSKLLKEGVQKMSEIIQSNLDTIYEIKDLSERVNSISSIVDSIDGVTERTKTIAFNAELEASVIGEQGEKFHIVASEILRLVAAIKSANNEIRYKITDIIHSCDNLIISSESGTQKTKEGSEFYVNLENNFNKLCLSSDITAESLRKVTDITDIQQGAFSQINSVLAEIITGFEIFSQNSQKISRETRNLNEAATNLGYSTKVSKGGSK